MVLGAVLRRDAGTAKEIQNQLGGLGGFLALAAGTAVKAGLTTKRAHREGYGETFTSTEDQGSMGVQAFMPTRKSLEKLSV